MRRVTGIGGISFKARGATALQAWDRRHLGIDVQTWGGAAFPWTDPQGQPTAGPTVWSIGPAGDDHVAPSPSPFTIHDRVEDLHALVAVPRADGCQVLDRIDESVYGRFAGVVDPEGSQVERWQPPPRPMTPARVSDGAAGRLGALEPTPRRWAPRAGA